MMCNPNQQPNENQKPTSGFKPTGLKSGSESPWTAQVPEALIAAGFYGSTVESFAARLSRAVEQLRDQWLAKQLQRHGLPPETVERVYSRDPHTLHLVANWIREQGFCWSAPTLDTIQLFKHGILIASAQLFELPKYESVDAPRCC